MKLRLEARVSSESPDAVGRFLVGNNPYRKLKLPLMTAANAANRPI